jgi:hypothetical protein
MSSKSKKKATASSKVTFLDIIKSPQPSTSAITDQKSDKVEFQFLEDKLSHLPEYRGWELGLIRNVISHMDTESMQRKRKDSMSTKKLRSLLHETMAMNKDQPVLESAESRADVLKGIRQIMQTRSDELQAVCVESEILKKLARRFSFLGQRHPNFDHPKMQSYLRVKLSLDELLCLRDAESLQYKKLDEIMRTGTHYISSALIAQPI